MTSKDQNWENVLRFGSTLAPEELSFYHQLNLSPQILELGKALCAPFIFHEGIKEKLLKPFDHAPSEIHRSQDSEFKNAVQKLISNIGESQPGVSFLAILHVLSTYFNDASVASVFCHLAIDAKVPEDLLLPAADWEHLSRTLNTRLALNKEFESLLKSYIELGSESVFQLSQFCGIAHICAEGVVDGLHALKRISMGVERRTPISFYWGPDACWIAAVANWLFKLGPKMEICARDRSVLWSGVDTEETKVEARFMFHEPGVPVDSEPIFMESLVLRLE